ncbi:unnamed protein product [Musa acuminata var. zebrina]
MRCSWRKAKRALGMSLCVFVPTAADDDDEGTSWRRCFGPLPLIFLSSIVSFQWDNLLWTNAVYLSDILLINFRFQKTCSICLGTMKAGNGHALFTAECSHTFHFPCIVSNVKYGNYVCPVCRARWKEIPFQAPLSSEHPRIRTRVDTVNWSQEDDHMMVLRMLHCADSSNRQHHQPPHLQSEMAATAYHGCAKTTYPEFLAIPQSASKENFTVLIHLKAPHAGTEYSTKLALLKHQALEAVNSLVSSGGTNIAEGLRKCAKVIEDRKEHNPVCSIILLSDGQDTYTLTSNHDSTTMHSISEISGGTFSFIESEVVIQDAFAQCIGGLLSVVMKEMQMMVQCVDPGVQLVPIKSGSYANRLADDSRSGTIIVGDLYADEAKLSMSHLPTKMLCCLRCDVPIETWSAKKPLIWRMKGTVSRLLRQWKMQEPLLSVVLSPRQRQYSMSRGGDYVKTSQDSLITNFACLYMLS